MTPRRICVITGSRAEYGLLYWLLCDLRHDPEIELQLVVTGMHLSPEFGMTVEIIERDGFEVSRKVDMLLSSDSGPAIAKSVGLGVIGMADAFAGLRPDIVVLLGDRFEILAAALAATFQNLPIAHIAGGDTTEGAFDEAIRHSITKMAHFHFVTNPVSAARVRQMGEASERVYDVGSPGLDHLARGNLLGCEELQAALGAPLGERNFLVTFHPVTLESGAGVPQLAELFAALDSIMTPADAAWITRPNADTGGRDIAHKIDEWAAGRQNVHVYTSLGQQRYLSLMRISDVVIGNSSSGLYEAPSLGVPTVDIGDRQKGRLVARSVLRCAPDRGAITEAVRSALALDCSARDNPYGDGRSSARIHAILKQTALDQSLIKKRFHSTDARRD